MAPGIPNVRRTCSCSAPAADRVASQVFANIETGRVSCCVSGSSGMEGQDQSWKLWGMIEGTSRSAQGDELRGGGRLPLQPPDDRPYNPSSAERHLSRHRSPTTNGSTQTSPPPLKGSDCPGLNGSTASSGVWQVRPPLPLSTQLA